MPEDIHEAPTAWRKAIPEGRDRLQSRLLVGIMLPILVLLGARLLTLVFVVMKLHPDQAALRSFLFITIGTSLTFSLIVWALRAATLSAAFAGGIVCLIILTTTVGPGFSLLHSGFVPLAVLFVLTFAATKAGKRRKAQAGLAESSKGRSASQVIANLGVAALGSVMLISRTAPQSAFIWEHMGMDYDTTRNLIWLSEAVMLAALCEATADTVSSEIGQAFGGRPFLITTRQTVPSGTNGAITGVGTISGIIAAATVACAGVWSMNLGLLVACTALLGGVFGLFFDSLLGATVERKGWLGNDLVNFASTLAAAAFALAVLACL